MTTLAPDLTDRYELLEALSGSGLYAVYRARDRSEGETYLIRVPRAHVLEDPMTVDRFRAVMADIQRVDQRGALQVREVGGSGTDLWIVSQDSNDPTLRGLMPEGIELGRALDAVAEVADTLEAIHLAGGLHGDIRPINVHLSDDGRAQVAGAGTAFLAEAVQSLIRSSMQTPPPSYKSPEILRGGSPSVQSDVYALGMLLYEVTTGSLPFPGNSVETVRVKQQGAELHRPSVLNGDLPEELDGLITKALAWDPNGRHGSARELGESIRAIRAGLDPNDASLIVPHPESRNELRLQQGLASRRSQSPEFLEAAEADGIKVCPICLTLNTRHAESCSYCWRSLEAVPVLSTVQGEEFTAEARRKSRRRRLIRRGLLVAGVVIVAVVLFAERNVPPGLVSGPPTTSLTAAQGLGLWSTPRNGSLSSGAVLDAPSIPTGTLVWSRELGDETAAPVTVADGKVFVATRDRRIVALDSDDGGDVWTYPTSTPLDVPPVIAGDLGFIASRDSHITAFDVESGETVWRENVGSPSFGWVAVDEGNLFATTNDGLIHALDAATGVVRWRLSTGDRFFAAPAVGEDRLVVATLDRRVLFLNPFTGATTLVYLTRSAVDGTPAMHGSTAYVASNDRVVRAVHIHARNKPLEKSVLKWWAQFFIWGMAPFPPAQSGTVWAQYIGERVSTSPAISESRVIVAGNEGTVFALDAADGQKIWQVRLEDAEPQPTSPIVVNDVVYVGTKSGRMHALDARTGESVWTFDADSAIAGNPAFAEGQLYFATVRGTVYALE